MKNRIQTAFAIVFGLLVSGFAQAQEKIEYPTNAIEFVATCKYQEVPYWSMPNENGGQEEVYLFALPNNDKGVVYVPQFGTEIITSLTGETKDNYEIFRLVSEHIGISVKVTEAGAAIDLVNTYDSKERPLREHIYSHCRMEKFKMTK